MYDSNKETQGNIISHLLDSGFDSVLKYMGAYLGLDGLVVLLLTLIGVSYIKKVHKRSDMSNMKNRAFSTMVPLQIMQRSYLVLYTLSGYESKGED